MNAYETALSLAVMARAGEDGTVDTDATLDGSEQDNLPTTGYYVGGVRPSLVVSDATLIDRGEVAWFVGGTDARYFGVWKDTETGMIYIDASDHVDNRQDALYLATERGEIAVWDIANGVEIRVNADQGAEAE